MWLLQCRTDARYKACRIMIEYITLAGLFLASFFDLKERELPRVLTYGMVLLGFVLNFLVFREDFLIKGVSVLACIILAYLFYKFGVWAGGDFKLFAGIAFLMPVFGEIMFFPLIILLFALLSFFPFALVYICILTVKNKKLQKKVLKKFWKKRYDFFYSANFLFLIYWFDIHLIFGVALFILLEWQKKYTKCVFCGVKEVRDVWHFCERKEVREKSVLEGILQTT